MVALRKGAAGRPMTTARVVASIGLILSVCGCVPSLTGPTRLYPVDAETEYLKQNVGYANFGQYAMLPETQKIDYRNNYIGVRMYAIDVQYYDYESRLTHERQEMNFGAATAAIALNTTSTLVPVTQTKNLLTGISSGVTGANAAYNSEVLLNRTIQIVQDQMRADRAQIATRILAGLKKSSADYTLAQAMSDLEEYYQAGTLTAGLMGAQRTVAGNADAAEAAKADYVINTSFTRDDATTLLRAYIYPGGKYSKDNAARLNALLAGPDFRAKQPNGKPWPSVQVILYGAPAAAARLELLVAARNKGYIK